MKNIINGLVLATTIISSQAFAQIAFKGVELGSPISEAQVETVCGKKGLIALGNAGKLVPSSKNDDLLVCKGNVSYAGYEFGIESGVQKADNSLYGVQLSRSFSQGAFDAEPHAGAADLETKMIITYGQPVETKTVTLQNGFGATRNINAVMVWRKGDYTIVKFDEYKSFGRLGYMRDVVVVIAPTSYVQAKLDAQKASNVATVQKDM